METNEIKALINSKLTLPEMQRQFVSSTNKTKIAIVWQGDRISQSTVNSSWLDYSSQAIKKSTLVDQNKTENLSVKPATFF